MNINFFIHAIVLLIASIEDIKTRNIRNIYCIIILLLNLFTEKVLYKIIIGVIVFIILALQKENVMGGGDIKVISCLALYGTGEKMEILNNYIYMIVLSLIIASIYIKTQRTNKVPYMPCILTSFIIIYGLLKTI
ncbi:MAG: prepilin peptidase [Eubacteriales bacterium]|nr:prepilin peptidase [Eubacteriales bacterium]